MTTETLPLSKGVYHKATVGFTLTDDGPLWSVDIETTLDGPTFVGTGPTLEEAAEAAAETVANFGSVTIKVVDA